MQYAITNIAISLGDIRAIGVFLLIPSLDGTTINAAPSHAQS
jgi:hypothetical protein